VDTTQTITHLGLCAGYGGIELGLHRVIRNLRTVALCEIEAFACANLVAKMEAGLMDAAPIWTDLKTFPWAEFRDRVDILTGGYPCQPFSAAGKRLGTDDPRHLWPFIAYGIRILRPKLCFFENVEGHISLGLREVIGELGAIGYQAAWGIFSAAEVGAPHQRKRVFILAYYSSSGLQGREWIRQAGTQGASSGYIAERSGSVAVSNSLGGASGLSRSLAWNERFAGVADNGGGEGCGELADSSRGRFKQCESKGHKSGWISFTSQWPSRRGEPQHGWEPPRVVGNAEGRQDHGREPGDLGEEASQGGCGNDAADGAGENMADGHRIDRSAPAEGREHDRQAGSSGEELGDTEGRDGLGSAQRDPGHAAQPDEGAGSGQTQSTLGGDVDGPAGGLDYAELQVTCDNRTDELRLLGNGVVPATAERAFRILMEELI
jgi:DNA (cytosine-5)-methyltransferase 1